MLPPHEGETRWPGVFVVFEGIDGSGKSTQLKEVAKRLRAAGLTVFTSREPTDHEPWGARLRRSMVEGRMSAEDEVRHFLEDRRQHLREHVLPALHRGEIVLVDRYYLSTAAYQGRRGFDVDELLARNEAFAPAPDLALIFEISPERALQRAQARGATDEFERIDELREVAAIFASINRPWIRRLDADRESSAVTRDALEQIVEGPLRARRCARAPVLCTPPACDHGAGCALQELRRALA